MYPDIRGEWRWYLQSANGRKLADSGEGYKNKQDCFAAIELVKSSMYAEVRESLPQARFGLMPRSRGLLG
ncbi:MAG: YegP family protein [Burkholderiales bacterium]